MGTLREEALKYKRHIDNVVFLDKRLTKKEFEIAKDCIVLNIMSETFIGDIAKIPLVSAVMEDLSDTDIPRIKKLIADLSTDKIKQIKGKIKEWNDIDFSLDMPEIEWDFEMG